MIWFILLFVLLFSYYMYFVLTGKRHLGFYVKGFTSFSFILIFAYAFIDHFVLGSSTGIITLSSFSFAIFVCLGLVAGLTGDLFLEMLHVGLNKDRTMIIAFGTIIFLFGHLFYIFSLTHLTDFSFISLIVGAVMTAVVIAGGKLMKLNMGKLEILSYVYAFVIFTMIGQSIMSAIQLEFSTFSLMFMIGAIFFGISDLFIAPLFFGDGKKNSIVIINLVTYYIAQALIASSLYFM